MRILAANKRSEYSLWLILINSEKEKILRM